MVYGDGLFVAVGSEGSRTQVRGAIFSSPNGHTWTRVANDLNVPLWDVAKGNGRIVAVGSDLSPGPALIPSATSFSSEDARTWSATDLPLPPAAFRSAFGNGLFVAAGRRAHLKSVDGRDWTTFGPPHDDIRGGVEFAGGHFVSWLPSSGQVLVSSDDDWQSVELPGAPYTLQDLRAVNGVLSGLIMEDRCFGEDESCISWGKITSSDGIDWVVEAQELRVPPAQVVVDTSSGCVAFKGDAVVSGPDCANLAVSFRDEWFTPHDALYASGIFLVAGSSGILSSVDGTSWIKSLWSE